MHTCSSLVFQSLPRSSPRNSSSEALSSGWEGNFSGTRIFDLSDLKVPHDAVIETVAEAVLNDPKPVAVIDDNNHTIGVLHRKSIIHILFGKDEEESSSTPQAAGA